MILCLVASGIFTTVINARQVTLNFGVSVRPNAPAYQRPQPPGRRYIWIEGDWIWRNGNYEFRQGYWELPRHGQRRVPGTWMKTRFGWQWQPGYWVRAGRRR